MKPILDVCCGGRMFYFDKTDPRVLFCDNRKFSTKLCDGRDFEVNPDIVFDPPHLLRNTGLSKSKIQYVTLSADKGRELPTGFQQIKYGALYSDWRDMLRKGFKECFRVLDTDGILIFKWNETDIKVDQILAFTDEKPVFGHRSGKRSNTHWLCFIKEVNHDIS